jgi:hypothetical protein
MTDEKEVEYYAAKANAWFNTKLEYDKSLLVLSAGAIGLLATLLTTVGVNSFALLFVFFAAIISFVVCLVAVLAIFSRNAKHLEDLIAGKKANDPVLGVLDSLTISSFIIGIILASIIGLASATTEVLKKEVIVTKEKETNQNKVPIRESFNGASNIAPQTTDTEKRSFNGAQNVSPPKQDGGTSNSSGGSTSGQTQSTDGGGNKKGAP